MKFLAIILVVFSLSGCFYQAVNQYDLKDAIKVCGSVENIADVTSSAVGNETVTCMDGRRFFLHQK